MSSIPLTNAWIWFPIAEGAKLFCDAGHVLTDLILDAIEVGMWNLLIL